MEGFAMELRMWLPLAVLSWICNDVLNDVYDNIQVCHLQ